MLRRHAALHLLPRFHLVLLCGRPRRSFLLSSFLSPTSPNLTVSLLPTAPPPQPPSTPRSLPDSTLPSSVSPSPRLPQSNTSDPTDPASRLFCRNLPRLARYTGAYLTSTPYADPTLASLPQVLYNTIRHSLFTSPSPPLYSLRLCKPNVSGLYRAFLVTTTLDLGDVHIPRAYAQAHASPEASYWREAIQKELRGLLDLARHFRISSLV